jgi:hypothetical protein
MPRLLQVGAAAGLGKGSSWDLVFPPLDCRGASLGLSFLISQMEIILGPVSEGVARVKELNCVKCVEQCPVHNNHCKGW